MTMLPLLRRRAARAVATVFVVLAAAGCAAPPAAGPRLPQRHVAVVAHPLAADAARDILRAGGSAVDAAIAAQMVLSVVEPQSSGIGGGAFLIHFDRAANRLAAYDGRETAPADADPRMFLTLDGRPQGFMEAALGGRSVGVPGVVAMLADAHGAHGILPWRRLFDRAIGLAEDGFEISPRLAEAIAADRHLKMFPAAAQLYLHADGSPRRAGEVMRNPALARSLRRVAAGGAEAFYGGVVASEIAAAVQSSPVRPARLTEADIGTYRAARRDVLCRPYRVWRVCGMPPPSSGGVTTLQILGLLEPFDMAAIAPGSPQAAHLIAEAEKLAYADRNAYLGDPDFTRQPVAGLLDRGYLKTRGALISSARAMGTAVPGLPPGIATRGDGSDATLARPSTSHLTIVDGAGNAVAMTSSIEGRFGSHVVAGGFFLNNQLTDFAFRPGASGHQVPNRVEPGKRPLSSMAPTLVFDRDGRLSLAIGSPGGTRIIAYVAQALIAALDWRLPMAEVVALPHVANRNGPTELESGTAAEALAAPLDSLGHTVVLRTMTSGLNGVRVTPHGLEAAADPRREGVALAD